MSKLLSSASSAVSTSTTVTNIPVAFDSDAVRGNENTLTFIFNAAPSAGTATVRVKAMGANRFVALKDKNGIAVVLSLATQHSLNIHGPLDAVEVDMANLGTATSWSMLLSSF